MNRKILSAAALLLIVLTSVMCLTACGGGSGSTDATLSAEEIAENKTITEKDGVIGGDLEDGTYTMVTIYMDGEESTKYFASMEKVGLTVDLEIKGTSAKIGETEYEIKEGKLVNSEETATYAVNGNKVTVLDSDNSKMIFEKK